MILNKVLLMGRLTKEPEIRYTQNEPITAIARYTLAVDRKYKDGETDFINCVAFGKNGEFAEKHLIKGMKIAICGRLQVRSWEDKDGNKRYATEVVVEEHYFCESKKDEKRQSAKRPYYEEIPITYNDEDLPF